MLLLAAVESFLLLLSLLLPMLGWNVLEQDGEWEGDVVNGRF